MKEIRRITLTVTRRRTLRLNLSPSRAHCPDCAREVETLSAHEAAAVLGVDEAAFDSLLAAGQVHVLQAVSGSLRICQASLFVSLWRDNVAHPGLGTQRFD